MLVHSQAAASQVEWLVGSIGRSAPGSEAIGESFGALFSFVGV